MPLLTGHIAVGHRRGLRDRPRDRGRLCPRGRARRAARHQRSGGERRGERDPRRRRPARQLCARRDEARRLRRDGETDRGPGRAGLDPGQQCRHRAAQRHDRRRRGRDQGLGRHHRDQPHRRVQRHPRLPAGVARGARAASSISDRSSPSCMCARRARRPIPPRSTACSASPARSPPSSARKACG